ncbi:MAG: RHS repeat-associated core domain-containing protein [Acidimicrobiales bacterium]
MRHVVVGRYYDPQTGQFLSVDPMVQQTDQAYVYVVDNPVSLTDPTGDLLVGHCGVNFERVHISTSRKPQLFVNEHVQVRCNEKVTSFSVTLQLWKEQALGPNIRVGTPITNTSKLKKDFDLVNYSARCTNEQPTVWFATAVRIFGVAMDGNPMYPEPGGDDRSPNSSPLNCGTNGLAD